MEIIPGLRTYVFSNKEGKGSGGTFNVIGVPNCRILVQYWLKGFSKVNRGTASVKITTAKVLKSRLSERAFTKRIKIIARAVLQVLVFVARLMETKSPETASQPTPFVRKYFQKVYIAMDEKRIANVSFSVQLLVAINAGLNAASAKAITPTCSKCASRSLINR